LDLITAGTEWGYSIVPIYAGPAGIAKPCLISRYLLSKFKPKSSSDYVSSSKQAPRAWFREVTVTKGRKLSATPRVRLCVHGKLHSPKRAGILESEFMKSFAKFLILLGPLVLLVACGGSTNTTQTGTTSPSNQQGPLFVTGEDAPVSSVVGFTVTINSITLNNSTTTVTAMSTPTTVDFGRLMGLRSMLGFNSVPQGAYTSATFTFATNPAPLISYVDLSTNPPTVQELTGTLNQATVTVPFPSGAPLVVTSSELVGLHLDFDMFDSLVVDGNNQMTGAINPVMTVQSVAAMDPLAQITEFTGNLVSVSTNTNSFVMQGPYGFQETVNVSSATQYNGSNSLSTLAPDAIISVMGNMLADGSMMASDVEMITTDKAFISGRILAINPTSGPVQTVTMWVGEELGTSGVIPVDTIQTINLSGVSTYDICFFDDQQTQDYFNASSLVVGQRIFIGGTVAGGAFTPDMVSLRRQAAVGQLVANSVTVTGATGSNVGNFQMQNDALMSYSAGGPFTVYTGNLTDFVNIDGLAGLAAAGTPEMLSRGLVFKNASSGKPEVWAGHVRILPTE